MRTVLQLKTRAEYEAAQEIYEARGWGWCNLDIWATQKEETAVLVGKEWGWDRVDYFRERGETVLDFETFCVANGIEPLRPVKELTHKQIESLIGFKFKYTGEEK